jgi:hypothetical protein
MRRIGVICFLLFITLSSFTIHKFYIAIYQINFVPEKKRIEITSRIFVDDLNAALEKRFKVKTHIGDATETTDDVSKMNQYLLEHFKIKVNGAPKNIIFISKEMESNVVVGYYKIVEVSNVKSMYVENKSLMEVFSEQQNIIQTNINEKKQSLLLSADNWSGVLK